LTHQRHAPDDEAKQETNFSMGRRFRERGRLAPEGLQYVASWVAHDLQRCYQVMACDDRPLLDRWMEQWEDLIAFEVVPVITSAEAAAAVFREGAETLEG